MSCQKYLSKRNRHDSKRDSKRDSENDSKQDSNHDSKHNSEHDMRANMTAKMTVKKKLTFNVLNADSEQQRIDRKGLIVVHKTSLVS